MRTPPRMPASAPNSNGTMMPPVLKWTMLLSLAFGLGLTLRWSWNPGKPPRAVFSNPLEAVTSLQQKVPGTPWTNKVDSTMEVDDNSGLGWPACITDARGRIENMALLDKLGKSWRTGEKQTASKTKLAVVVNRRLRQEDSSRADSKDSTDSSNSMPATGEKATAADQQAANSTAGRKAKSPRANKRQRRTKPSSLLAVVTANMWNKTELLLQSLTANNDAFEILVIDELSDDETPQRLQEYNIRVITPPDRLGVTYNWNLAYREWLKSDHEWLFYVNNDVLIPDGVIDAMAQAMTREGGNCDLVTPQSTIKGKGYWGDVEGLELQLNLTESGHDFANSPMNYRRVQDALTKAGCVGKSAVKEESKIHRKRPGFSGFFFSVRRGIQQWAFDEDNLFNPANRLFRQENDLHSRSQSKDAKKQAKICMHTGTFVFHYKGSTISGAGADRLNWHMPGHSPAEDKGATRRR